MDQPTIVLRIAANPIIDETGEPDPLVEVVSVVTVVNSTPAINGAVREFFKSLKPARFGKARVQRV